MQEVVYHNQFRVEESYWWFVARNSIVKSLTDKFCVMGKDDYWLDIGCGTGAFSKIMSSDRNIIGLDTSPIAVDYAKKRGLKNIFCSTLEDFPTGNYPLRGALMLDVIEHIENDKGIVRNVHDILPEKGWFVTTVPAYQWLWSIHDVFHMHYRRYTRHSFNRLLTDSGFKIVYTTYFNTFLFIPAILKRIFDKLTGKKENQSPIDIVPEGINKLFTRIFMAEKGFLKRLSFPFGVSILTIAQKVTENS